MRKWAVLAVLIGLVAAIMGAQNLRDAGLVGKVRTVDEETFALVGNSGEWIEDSLNYKDGYAYDERGNLVEWAGYEPDGRLAQKWVYAYDAKGRQTRREKFDGEGFLIVRLSSVYDDRGSRIAGTAYASDGIIIGRTKYASDAAGRETESAEYEADGTPSYRTTFAHDEEGRIVEEAEYYPDGSLGERRVFEYVFDQIGNWTVRTTSARARDAGSADAEPRSRTKRTLSYYP